VELELTRPGLAELELGGGAFLGELELAEPELAVPGLAALDLP
jgi:hypothetical protein